MIHHRSHLTDVEIRTDGRTLHGTVVPYGVQTRIGSYIESFARGAFAGTDPAAVPLLVAHRHAALPIGRAVALVDESDRLAGEFTLAETRDAEEVLALARDGVPLGLSVGFMPAEGGDRWTADRRKVVRTRATLAEVSIVGVPAYPGAGVQGVRGKDVSTTYPLRSLARRRA